MSEKRKLVSPHGTYRGHQILESEGKFILYIGTERHEFLELTQATGFIDEWIDLKKN